MQVYGSTVSPFVQRVLIAARYKGHDLALAPPPGGAIQSPEFRALSPMGRIPLLALDDGRHISESGAIAAYLDETLTGPPLLPGDPVAVARVREIEAIATLEYATGMRPVMVGEVFGMGIAPEVIAAARTQAEKGLDVLDALLDQAGTYAVGDTPTLADCVLVPTLHLARVIDRRARTAAMVDARPRLRWYMERLPVDPVACRCTVEMSDGFAAMLARNAAN